MAFRRKFRKSGRRIMRRSGGTRTRGPVKEPLWRVANFGIATQVAIEDPGETITQAVIMNPTLLLEQAITGDAQLQNVAQSIKGVHIGGIVWKTTWNVLVSLADDSVASNLVAYVRIQELLITQFVGQDGIPDDLPQFDTTWRPISALSTTSVPRDNNGDLIRIHHRKLALLDCGDNFMGPLEDSSEAYPAAAGSSTERCHGWGSTSLRLKRLITDDQQLVLHTSISAPSATSIENPLILGRHQFGHIYYRIGW